MNKNKIYYIDILIESIAGALKIGLGLGLAYIIAFNLLSAHITTLAENVCPLIK